MSTEEVIRVVSECVSTYKMEFDRDVLRSFRSRARESPALMFSRGLAYAIVYVASRSSETVFGIAFNARGCADLCARLREHAGAEEIRAEELGYALYGALLTFAIKAYGIVVEAGSGDLFKSLVEVFLRDPVANAKAFEVAEWIKRFAEAYITE